MAEVNPQSELRTVLLHYWLISFRGGERVVRELARIIRPDITYSHLVEPGVAARTGLSGGVRQTLYSRLPLARRAYKLLFPLMYLAAFCLPRQDNALVVSSESGPIKGIRKGPNTIHVCYCHSPFRILWAPAEWYRPVLGRFWRLLPILRWPLRLLDRLSARSVDCFIANSSFIRQRIGMAYGRDAVVIHPPADVDRFQPAEAKGDYFLWLGELVSYKRPDLVVSAFERMNLPLKVVGKGEMLQRLRSAAASNVEFLDRVTDSELPALLSRARALVFAGVEDFGIVFVEALAAGTPVIAYGEGGVTDIVTDGRSGVLFDHQSVSGLVAGIERFIEIESTFDGPSLHRDASRFSPQRFEEQIRNLLNHELAKRGMGHV